MFKLSTVSLFPILLFSIIARGALSFDAKSLALLVPPVSGETTIIFPDNSSQSGTFINGKFEGEVTLTSPDGIEQKQIIR